MLADTDADRIRAHRLASNAAVARHDTDAIAAFWSDAVQVTGSMGRQLAGPAANRRFYEERFAARPDTLYVRTPLDIEVMSAWGVALEAGEWEATWTDPDGPVRVAGRYMAQWLRAGGNWRIHGELYVPTTCAGGAYCARHPLEAR